MMIILVKWVSAFRLNNNDGNGGCSFLAAYRRINGSSPWAWSQGRRPSGAVLHSSHEPGVRCLCSNFMDMLWRLMNCRIIIIIIIVIIILLYCWCWCRYWCCGCCKAEETETRRNVEKSYDDAKVRHEMELTTLTENLSTLRAEMGGAAHRHTELDKTVKNLQAEKLGLFLSQYVSVCFS